MIDPSDTAVVAEVGRRVAVARIARQLTQDQFADVAGVGRSTVQRLERGDSIQLTSFVKILRALDRLEAFDAVLPREVRSPLAELERAQRRTQRVRAHGVERGATDGTFAGKSPSDGTFTGKSASDGTTTSDGDATWTWGDE